MKRTYILMRKILRGLVVATALSVAPASAVAVSTAPSQASETVVSSVSNVSASAPVAATAKAKPRRTITVRDLPGRLARLKFTVKPEYANKRLIIQTRKAGKFRTTGRMKTNGRGVAVRVFDGSRRGIRYRVIAKGGTKYATSGIAFTITRR